jgi:hypothetical protein
MRSNAWSALSSLMFCWLKEMKRNETMGSIYKEKINKHRDANASGEREKGRTTNKSGEY